MRLKDEQKQQAIIRAVLELTNERGLAGLKMSTLARRAGVATGTLYTYFEDKEDLLLSVNRSVRNRGAEFLLSRMSSDLGVRERMLAFIAAYTDYVGHNFEAILFVDLLKRSPVMTEAAKTETLERYGFLVELIREGIDSGDIEPGDPEVILHVIDSIVKGIVGQVIEVQGNYFPETKDITRRYAWAAIRAQ